MSTNKPLPTPPSNMDPGTNPSPFKSFVSRTWQKLSFPIKALVFVAAALLLLALVIWVMQWREGVYREKVDEKERQRAEERQQMESEKQVLITEIESHKAKIETLEEENESLKGVRKEAKKRTQQAGKDRTNEAERYRQELENLRNSNPTECELIITNCEREKRLGIRDAKEQCTCRSK